MGFGHLTILSQVSRLGRTVRVAGPQGALFFVIDALGLELLAGLASTTARRTAGAELDDECDKAESGAEPHESHHLGADVGFDVDIG